MLRGCFICFISEINIEMQEIDINDLVLDENNANDGTESGKVMLDSSLDQFGAGRSVLLDKNNRLLSGNHVFEAAKRAGIKKVIVVETEGEQLVAVKRTDVDLDSKEGREMAIADNAISKANLSWNKEKLKEQAEEFQIDMEKWGLQKEQADMMTENERQKYDEAHAPALVCPRCFEEFELEEDGTEE